MNPFDFVQDVLSSSVDLFAVYQAFAIVAIPAFCFRVLVSE